MPSYKRSTHSPIRVVITYQCIYLHLLSSGFHFDKLFILDTFQFRILVPPPPLQFIAFVIQQLGAGQFCEFHLQTVWE